MQRPTRCMHGVRAAYAGRAVLLPRHRLSRPSRGLRAAALALAQSATPHGIPQHTHAHATHMHAHAPTPLPLPPALPRLQAVLGMRGKPGHRLWRRLKSALLKRGQIEEFLARNADDKVIK